MAFASITGRPSRRVPPYLPLMLLVTGAYLTVEVPFAAHLLDVLGGDPTGGDIDVIEHFGRMLTGAAVAIAVMGWILARRSHRPFGRSLVVATVWSGMAMASTFHGLNQFAEHLGSSSTATERRDAFMTMLGRRALFEGIARQQNIPTGDDVVGSPQWRAFLSVAPALGGEGGGLLRYASADATRLAALAADHSVADLDEVRSKALVPAIDRMREAHGSYRSASTTMSVALSSLKGRSLSAWDDYEWRVKGRYKPKMTPQYAAQVRKAVRDKGVPVSDNWHPYDQAGFRAAFERKARVEIASAYADGVEDALGKGRRLDPGLGWEAFMAAPAVQAKLREAMGLTRSGPSIREGMDDEALRVAVAAPLRDRAVADTVAALTAPAGDFADGRRFDEVGRDAAKAVWLPTLALLLSMAGAALHIFKITYLAAKTAGAVTGRRWVATAGMPLGAAVVCAFGLWLAAPTNAVTSSRAFEDLRAMSAARMDPRAAGVLRAAIDMQGRFHAIGSGVGEAGPFRMLRERLPSPRASGAGGELRSASAGAVPGA